MEKESKSAIKREVEARQKLAVTITRLSEKQIEQLGLPEKLTAAILEYKKLNSNGALRRQAQYLGVLMRDVDPELIQKVMTQLQYRKS
jgi:ribosome-associated protein